MASSMRRTAIAVHSRSYEFAYDAAIYAALD